MIQKIKSSRGITLVALVVTIVILLILAGVTLLYASENDGIFRVVDEAKEKTEVAKAREKLELVLKDAQIKKRVEGLTNEELDIELEKIGSVNENQVTIDQYVFEIDRKVLKIAKYIGKNSDENTKQDVTEPVVSAVNVRTIGKRLLFSAEGIDQESGLKQFHYDVQPTTGLTKSSGTFAPGQTVELTSTSIQEYTVSITAEDNNGNKTATPVIGKATTKESGIGKHINIAGKGSTEIDTKELYGAKVTGYTCGRTDVEWKIFYIDEEDNNRVYLLAKDCVVPPHATEYFYKGGGATEYGFSTNSLANYSATIVPNTPFTQKFLKEYAGTSIASSNQLKVTALMLDYDVWSEFSNSNMSDFACGGPTLPFYISSINDVCKEDERIQYSYTSASGYKVESNGSGQVYSIQNSNWGELLDGMYFKPSSSAQVGFGWIASPHGSSDRNIWFGWNGGRLQQGRFLWNQWRI